MQFGFPATASARRLWPRPSRSLTAVGASLRPSFDRGFRTRAIGGDALDRYGVPVRAEDIEATRRADAALLGAVGGPKWDAVEPALRPGARTACRSGRRSDFSRICGR